MESAALIDEKCPDKTISFRFAEGSDGSHLFSAVERRGDRSRQRKHRVVVKVVDDKNLKLLWNYWGLSAEGERCIEDTPFESLPDCRTYRATATFIGRVDGVSKAVHAAHLKKSPFTAPDWKGFGDMGMFEAQIVAGSVEDVVAVEEPVKWTPALMEVPH